ncbi:MAG: hypothetical protein FWE31_02390 [Firmicutes bacterium]|nr:hypothetical protein [Bacillota bacterium]
MRKFAIQAMSVALVAVLAAVMLVGCGGNGDSWAMNLDKVKFREQRSPSGAFYRLGSAAQTGHTASTRGHFGTQAEGAVTVNSATNTITITTASYASEVAVDVRNMFPNFDYLTTLRIRAAAAGETAAGNWVSLRTTSTATPPVTTNGEHFHTYAEYANGWATGMHAPAYFVVGAPEVTRTIEVNGTYYGKDFTFFVVINKTQTTDTE